jgi:hypothetical protein
MLAKVMESDFPKTSPRETTFEHSGHDIPV